MRLLLINPNTTVSMTDRMLELGRPIAGPSVQLVGATGRFGARYVASRASYAIAGHAALDCYAEQGQGVDAVLLACFGDPALFALKELSDAPVIGMAEASCQAASVDGRRFSIVTGGERWRPMLEEFVASIGLRDRLAGIAAVAPTGGDIARDPEGALAILADACCHCVRDHGADTVILGGAGLAGLATRIQDRVQVPLIDSFEAVLHAGLALARTKHAKPTSGTFAQTPPVETVGLSPSLTSAFKPK